jgi:hypothetical protein
VCAKFGNNGIEFCYTIWDLNSLVGVFFETPWLWYAYNINYIYLYQRIDRSYSALQIFVKIMIFFKTFTWPRAWTNNGAQPLRHRVLSPRIWVTEGIESVCFAQSLCNLPPFYYYAIWPLHITFLKDLNCAIAIG